jgi:glycosyltransferase involved in cell wall biosynthesis
VNGPSVSVLIPARDAEPFVGAAVESALAQDYEPIEAIVVDDGSVDGTAAVAAAAGARVIGTPPLGIPQARNALIDAAEGEVVAFLDADDAWLPGALALRVRALLDDPELDYLLARVQPFLEPGVECPDWLDPAILDQPLQQGLLSTFVGRRRVFDTVGRFDTRYPVGEDTEWFARAADAPVRGTMLMDVCTRYRIHEHNTTRLRNSEIHPLLLRTVRESLQRRRAMAGGEASS